MDKPNIVKLLGMVGVSADELPAGHEHGDTAVAVTSVQFTKAQTLGLTNPTRIRGTVDGGRRLVVVIDFAALEVAVQANVKAPRSAGSANVQIEARTVYYVNVTDSVNDITEAMWSSLNKVGWIMVNDVQMVIEMSRAEEYYNAPEDEQKALEWDPDRPIYVIRFVADVEGVETEDVLTSYGLTNLIRRIANYGGKIIRQ